MRRRQIVLVLLCLLSVSEFVYGFTCVSLFSRRARVEFGYSEPQRGRLPEFRSLEDSDGRFLVQSEVYGYGAGVLSGGDHPRFDVRMNQAINTATRMINGFSYRGTKVQHKDLMRVVNVLRKARFEAAKEVQSKEVAVQYGFPMPSTIAEVVRVTARDETWAREKFFSYGEYWDHISLSIRHAYYYDRVSKIFASGDIIDVFEPKIPSVDVKGERVLLSSIEIFGENDYALLHPSNHHMNLLRERGYERILEVLNAPTMGREVALERLAAGYFDLMQAPPFVLGSPSIVESLIESILRSKYRIGLPAKKIKEGFWEVNLWDPEGPRFSAKDFLGCWTDGSI